MLAVGRDVRKHLDEGVLHRFVGIVRVAQVVIRDAQRAALLSGDEVGEPVAGGIALAGDDQRLDGGGQLRILRQRAGAPAAGAAAVSRGWSGGCRRRAWDG